MIVALDTAACPAQICRHPEPVRAGVNQDAKGLARRTNVEFKEYLHSKVAAYRTPRLISVSAVSSCLECDWIVIEVDTSLR